MRFLTQLVGISLTPFLAIAMLSLVSDAQPPPGPRLFKAEDLFRVWRIGATKWSPNGRFSAIEVLRPERTLDPSLPTGEIRVLDSGARTLRTISSSRSAYIGFFNPLWSPDGRHLAFLSVDVNAIVQPWIWTVGTDSPRLLSKFDVKISIGDIPLVWVDNDHLAVVAWEDGAEKSGPLYFRIMRGRKIADGWKRAIEMKVASVSVLESGANAKANSPKTKLILIDIRSHTQRTLADGGIHRLKASADGRFIAFLEESPGVPTQQVASYFAAETEDDAYDAVNWGTKRKVIDVQTGTEVESSSMTANPSTANPPKYDIPLPLPGARRLSISPTGEAALFFANDASGSRLLLAGGGGRSLSDTSEIWRANEWVREIRPGIAKPISYKSTDGKTLTAWLLLPPDYRTGTKIPLVTIVSDLTNGASPPPSLSLLQPDFEHPQLFAALGYGVLLPSMPEAEIPTESHSLQRLANNVLPAIDAVINGGIADPERLAVVGQSYGGFAVLGLLTQTTRFRSAIASAGYSDFISLYGTFYGQYRNGDAGLPQAGIVLRGLQLEKGWGGMAGPPWDQPQRYIDNSAILQANKVVTPLMLVHGDLDFIPIQQSEEFFTALYRQDKRAVMVRYQGEWHTIASRSNVLDLWHRIRLWLNETLESQS